MKPYTRSLAKRCLLGLLICGICLYGSIAFSAVPAPSGEVLKAVLGSPASEWSITSLNGALEYTTGKTGGRNVINVGPSGMTLVPHAKIPDESEVNIRFRLTKTEGARSLIGIAPGLGSQDETNPNSLALSLSHNAGMSPDTLWWQFSKLPGGDDGLAQYYSSRNIPSERLTYPDFVRASVEQDTASLKPLNERWLTLRYVIHKNDILVYLDGRMLSEFKGPEFNGSGFLRLTLYDGVQLASFSVKPLAPANPLFETVNIENYLNGSKIAGVTIKNSKAFTRGKQILVGKVPFVVPQPDEAGNDHLDLSRSWMRFGPIEGYHYGNEGETARWMGALTREGGRIQLRIRNAQYSNLHLLAAFEGKKDTTPVITAQFYRANEGHPINFKGRAPLFSAKAKSVSSIPVTLSNGKKGYLYDVVISMSPDGVAKFSDIPYLEVELTKEISVYRSYPDPAYYGMHGAGLQSGVHVYAVTLERPPVEVTLTPDNYAHIWTSPETPSYTVKLSNITNVDQKVNVTLSTISYDGLEKTSAPSDALVPANSEKSVKIPITLTRYGTHDIKLQVKDSRGGQTQTRSLAYLHPDTRERENWEEGKGPIFGFWDWKGNGKTGHITPAGVGRIDVMVKAGAESSFNPISYLDKDDYKYYEDHKMQTFFLHYQLYMTKDNLGGVEWDPSKPEEMGAALIAEMKKSENSKPSAINKPDLAVFFAEPLLGPISYSSRPENFGEPELKLTEDEEANYKDFLDQFVIAARAIKKEWPSAKCLMPWGIPSFPIEFLKYSKEATELMDGPALDVVQFVRMPEMQIDQVTYASVMWQLKQQWEKTGKPWPKFTSVEGPCVAPSIPGALTRQQEAELFIRGELVLNAYGLTRLLGMPTPFDCAGAWGETHYGGGMCEGLPLLSPKPMYTTFATLTRQLNRMNFIKSVPTPSTSVFCLQYKHYKTGKMLHIFWTLRGTRQVTLDVPAGAKLTVYDQMDNETMIDENGGKASFTIGTSPCYVWGIEEDAKVALGEPNHADSAVGTVNKHLGNLGDGSWKVSTERDTDYETCHQEFVTKFPGVMTASTVAVPAKQGKTALAVRLEKQEKERKVMPFYTTLVPKKPIHISGKASHLGLWVNAAGDWGRVVYCLKDAKGERWLSVGKKDDWNCDDNHSWSRFNFDGWRYLKFEMPGNAPWDGFREAGTSFWGYYGKGDHFVDLPLTLEKIIVERRTHIIKVDELMLANPQDVLFGDLYAEYVTTADTGVKAERLSKLRMPTPKTMPELPNPIADLAKSGTGTPVVITGVKPPQYMYDGTRCHVFFNTLEDAQTYDVWVSPYPDGRGALLLGQGWTESGTLLTGLHAGTDLYLYMVATTADGKTTPPSQPFKINLKDMFAQK